MPRRIFIDTAWTAAPWSGRAELMWIGLADESGRSWHGISSEVVIDPSINTFVSRAFGLIERDEPRISRERLAAAVREFCGDVQEFWAWVSTLASFAEFSGLGEQALAAYRKHWGVDLHMLKTFISPWPEGWPDRLCDLNAAAPGERLSARPRSTCRCERRDSTSALHRCRTSAVA
jgi:hypothetical protein